MLRRMSSRGILSLALILVGVGCERFAYYGARAFLVMDMRSGGEGLESYATVYSTMMWLGVFCSFAGAGVAFGIGPRATAAIGALVSVIGCFVLVAGSYKAGGFVLSAGAGILRPCPAAAAAEVLGREDGDAAPSPRRFAAVTAFMLFVYAAINAGALAGPLIGKALRTDGTSTVAYAVDGIVMFLGAGAIAAAAVLGFQKSSAIAAPPPTDVYRTPGLAPQTQPAPTGNALVGVAILATASAIYAAGLVASFPARTMGALPDWIHSINPIVVVIVATIFGCIWVAGTQQRWTISPLSFYGAGIAIFAFGLFVIAISGESVFGNVAGQIIAAAGESPAGTIGTAFAALAVRNRGATLVVAGWMALGSVVNMLAGSLMTASSGVVIVLAFVLGAAGVAFAALGKRIHREFFERPLSA